MILLIFLVPALAGLLSFMIRSDKRRRGLLLATTGAHLVLVSWGFKGGELSLFGGWLVLDALGKLFLLATSFLFFVTSVYAVEYFRKEGTAEKKDLTEDFTFVNAKEASFTGCFLLFLATMTLVMISGHLGLLWIGMEATTLASAPLIFYHRHHRSLEATWKYLLICSVGIALALLGTLMLAVAFRGVAGHSLSLLLSDLVRPVSPPNLLWLKTAFLFLCVGYGTKMGLAPLHSWLPDAHSEAPSFVSALLSGALLNVAFLGILRVHQICVASGLGAFSRDIFLLFGVISMILAAVFIVRQSDYKRMLAYSSIEHMGILAVGIGLGGVGTFGALLHVVNHALTKGALFLTAGNILSVYKTKRVGEVSGLVRKIPASGVLWLLGFLAISGSPPSGVFMSEVTILWAAVQQGRWAVVVVFLGVIFWVFASMAAIFVSMVFGDPKGHGQSELPPVSEHPSRVVPVAALLIGVGIMGIFIPGFLADMIREITVLLEVR